MLESIAGYLQLNSEEIFSIFLDFFKEPFMNQEMKWIIIPVILTILVMEFYYSKHKREELGWNTATANSLVLVFISRDMFRFLSLRGILSFSEIGSYAFSASILVLIVLLEGVFMLLLDFSHLWPKFLAFQFSSHLTVNLIAFLSVVIIYSAIPITGTTIAAAIIFFLFARLFFFLIRMLYPSNN